MACFNPINGYRAKTVNDNGKRPVVFKPSDGLIDMPVKLPCGQCIGCRLERSRQWAVRCVNEASLHQDNSFITLTFNDEHLDPNGSLVKADFQKFMKRLRKEFPDQKIRYFHCGEYGDINQRPHHHAILFGLSFPDAEIWTMRNNLPTYRSKTLERLWPYGYSEIGSVTFESCAYVARYILKKVTGDQSDEFYGSRIPPYVTMSRRPGIGADWFAQFQGDVYPADFCVIRNDVIVKPPKFYDKILERESPVLYSDVKRRRLSLARDPERIADNSLDRLAVKEQVQLSKLKQLPRQL